MGIYPPSGTGHAVGLLRRNNTTTIFFDPNFGTYEFKQLFKLKAAAWLFRTGYPSIDAANTSDAHVYEVGAN